MKKLGIDVVISAPQKGWSGPACCGLVMMNDAAKSVMDGNPSTSFCCNLKKWLTVMQKYEADGFMYYTTLPTDSLTVFRNVVQETEKFGLDLAKQRAVELGERVRELCASLGAISVADSSCAAPTVVVVHAPNKDAALVGKLKSVGIQVAGGVPFKIDEPEGIVTFRIGLFGLDKLADVDRTVELLETGLREVLKN